MYMRFRMQIESVMKEVTFRAEPRARKSRAGTRGTGGAQEREASPIRMRRGWVGGVGAEGWVLGVGMGRAKSQDPCWEESRDAGEIWVDSLTSQMWKLRSRRGKVLAKGR